MQCLHFDNGIHFYDDFKIIGFISTEIVVTRRKIFYIVSFYVGKLILLILYLLVLSSLSPSHDTGNT